MKISQFAALISSGVTFNLRMSDAGDNNIQLDLIPVGKTNKAGISLPPKSFIGTAAEIDDQLPGYLEKYLGACQRITLISATAEADLLAAEEDAKKTAADQLAAKKATAQKNTPTKKVVPGAKPARDMNAGMIDDETEHTVCSEETCGADNSDSDDDVPQAPTNPSVVTTTPPATEQSALDPALF